VTQTDTTPARPLLCEPFRDEYPDRCAGDVHDWFDLTYASYLVLPRSLLQLMPPAWQHAMVQLLERANEEFPGAHGTYSVHLRDAAGRFVKDPLRNYRYPDAQAIADVRRDERL
jgi:hypothetical protein